MQELIEKEIYWFRKLEREGYYRDNGIDIYLNDVLEVIKRIEKHCWNN